MDAFGTRLNAIQLSICLAPARPPLPREVRCDVVGVCRLRPSLGVPLGAALGRETLGSRGAGIGGCPWPGGLPRAMLCGRKDT